MSHRTLSALAFVATGSFTLAGVSSPAFAANFSPGDVHPAAPAPASSPEEQPGSRVEDVLLSVRQAEAGGLTVPEASSAQETADDTRNGVRS